MIEIDCDLREYNERAASINPEIQIVDGSITLRSTSDELHMLISAAWSVGGQIVINHHTMIINELDDKLVNDAAVKALDILFLDVDQMKSFTAA